MGEDALSFSEYAGECSRCVDSKVLAFALARIKPVVFMNL